MLKEYSCGDFYIRHAVDDAPDDSDFNMHIHDRCEIFFLVCGSIEYLVEGSRYPLTADSIMIMRPSEVHKAHILKKERYERYAVNFPLSFAESYDPEGRLTMPFTDRALGRNNLINCGSGEAELIKKLLAEICDNSSDEYAAKLAVSTHFPFILNTIMQAFNKGGGRDSAPESTAGRIVSYVSSHLFEEISIPTLAEHFFLSTSQFSRIFRQATGAAPWEYITKKRLTAAKEKIRSGQTAQRAAEECGFGDYSAFYRAYIKHFGSAPTDE